MKTRTLCAFIAVMFLATATLKGDQASKTNLEGVKCAMNLKGPAKNVTGSSIAYKGGQLFFCCANCPKAFAAGLKDDAKKGQLMAQGNWQLVATKQAKVTGKCPISGRPVNAEQTAKVNGVEVGFCCPNCKGKVAGEADAKKQVALVFAEKPFKLAYALPAKEKAK